MNTEDNNTKASSEKPKDDEPPQSGLQNSTGKIGSLTSSIKNLLIGPPRNIKDPNVFHKISLIALLAWVGLGADGLSSSSYGPDEAFRALGEHRYMVIGLAFATAFTVFIISYAYSRIIEHFPFGGGGYGVATKLLGPKFGVISGAALLVDYVLTISVSIASAVDQIFSTMPSAALQYKMFAVAIIIGVLMLLNLRGVKESIKILVPIFVLFLITHIVLIFGGILSHGFEIAKVGNEVSNGFNTDMATIGFVGMLAIFIRAYSMGAGTYTGIEAVSNSIQVMREPKVETARRTMVYMAISLAVTAGGILICYLLYNVVAVPGKTMNAVLLERFAGSWKIGNLPVGNIFVVLTLVAEAGLLFVAAQTGFIGGPRIMSNMAIDSWLPNRFNSLSDRLTMQNGVILMASAALITLFFTGGKTSTLVLMYSINVFLTFSLAQMGMVRYWIQNRKKFTAWSRHIIIHWIGLVLCVGILLVSVFEKFAQGGWVTVVVTVGLVGLCLVIKRHYKAVSVNLNRLDDILSDIPIIEISAPKKINPKEPTAVLLVSSFGGLGIHSFLQIQKLFPNHYKNFIFASVNVIDAGSMKGAEDVNKGVQMTEISLKKYVDMAKQFGFAADYRMKVGTEVLPEAEKLAVEISKEYPQSIFFTSKIVFQKEKWYQRLLHNETAAQLQRRFQFAGLNTMVLPIRVFAK
jgi:amino acid transporter